MICCPSLPAATSVKMLQLPGNAGMIGDVVVDPVGQIHAVWLQADAVFYAVSSDEGKSFSAPVQISPANEGASGGMFRGPQMSLDRDATIHVVWYPDQSKLPDKKDWGVRYARLLKGAGKFSDAVNLGQIPSDNYSVAADGKGQVAVVWTSGDVYVTLSKNEGESFDQPQKIAGLDPCQCCATASYFDANGKLALLYRDKRNDDRNVFLVFDVLNASNQRIQLNEENWKINACPIAGHSLVMLPQSGFVAGWEEKGSAFLSLSSSMTTPPRQILLGTGKYPRVLVLSDGTVFAGWKQGSDTLWKTFDMAGTELASGKVGATPSSAKFGAALSSKGVVLVTP